MNDCRLLLSFLCQIADFGMSRDLMDENYYVSHGGKIPVKWTAPEVCTTFNSENSRSSYTQRVVVEFNVYVNVYTGSTLQEVLHCQ